MKRVKENGEKEMGKGKRKGHREWDMRKSKKEKGKWEKGKGNGNRKKGMNSWHQSPSEQKLGSRSKLLIETYTPGLLTVVFRGLKGAR